MAQSVGIGVDFGTSNSVVATYDGRETKLATVEQDATILPSAVYIDRQRQNQVGAAAIDAYIEGNRGRAVELVPEVVGKAELVVDDDLDPMSRQAPKTMTVDAFSNAMVDIGLPGQLFHGVKRLMGNPEQDRVMVFEQPYRIVALVTPILKRLNTALGLTGGIACHVGRPVNFEGHSDETNQVALDRLLESCGYAGFDVTTDLPEPIAATISYVTGTNIHRSNILTFDFGGGTLDLVVLAQDEEEHVVATHGIALGGDYIDQLLFEQLLFPLLGKGEVWRRQGVDRTIETHFPFELYEEHLLNWQRSYLLNQGQFRARIVDQIENGGEVGCKFQRLYDLIALNQTFEVFQAIRKTKEALSTADVATLDLPELDVELEVTRCWLDQLLAPVLDRIDDAISQVMNIAEMEDREIDVVLCTGGSSLIGSVQDLLARRFGSCVEAFDPFASVARGLAIADYRARVGS